MEGALKQLKELIKSSSLSEAMVRLIPGREYHLSVPIRVYLGDLG